MFASATWIDIGPFQPEPGTSVTDPQDEDVKDAPGGTVA